MKNKKHSKFIGVRIILLVCIIMLDLLGIGYGYWNNNLQVANSAATGVADPVFSSEYSLDDIQGKGELNISFDDKYTMNIQGRIGTDYQSVLTYGFKNDGTIPVKFTVQRQNLNSTLIDHVYLQPGIIDPGHNYLTEAGYPQLKVNAGEEGTHNFEIEFLFNQWNK